MIEGYVREMVNYLRKNLSKGYTIDSLRWALINQGYSRTQIEKAIELTNKELADEAPKLEQKPKITYQIVDENDKLITVKKPWWKRIFFD